jgi:kanamycin kinase
MTFEIGTGPSERWFVKWAPTGSDIDLDREAERLTWAVRWTPVPRLLDQGSDPDGRWIVTAGLQGESAVSARWKAEPATAVEGIGRGLRALHDALPIHACPFSWSADQRVTDARHRAATGQLDRRRWHPEHQHLHIEEALQIIAEAPPIDRLVVCHGDACAPNTLLDENGDCTGHVDLGDLGTGDRWADLAVATWSTHWNFGSGWEQRLLDAYGASPDETRTRYYRLLWDLGS